MIKLKSLITPKEHRKKLLFEVSLPPGFGTNDFESIEDFVAGKETPNKSDSNLDFSKIGESEGDEKFMGANVRDFPEMPQYLKRVAAKDKEPADKFKYPFIHRSNIVDDAGNILEPKDLKEKFTKRPDHILQQNAKLKKSGSKTYVFHNISMPAFKGLIVDESTGDFKIVDTCPTAGGCKVYCYAKHGGYVQWKSTSLSQTRTLNYLLNDWEGFKTKLIGEINAAHNNAKRRDAEMILRWHDAGDFMSEKYLDMAFEIAKETPEVTHYAYTKRISMVSAAEKPKNFVFNLSQGSTEDTLLAKTKGKHSVVVPSPLFKDFVEKDTSTGGWKFKSDHDYEQLKSKMAARYNIDKESIIDYKELMDVPYDSKEESEPKYNVIVKPGDGDDAAMRKDVTGMYLLIH